MAEKTIVVCDVCGKPATETVTIKVARGNYAKDLCAAHVDGAGRRRAPSSARTSTQDGRRSGCHGAETTRPSAQERRAPAEDHRAEAHERRKKAQSSGSSARSAKK